MASTEKRVKLTTDEIDFLSRLDDKPKGRRGLPLADRKQDRVRQRCKTNGWAKFIGGWINGKQYPSGWVITEDGRQILTQQDPSHG